MDAILEPLLSVLGIIAAQLGLAYAIIVLYACKQKGESCKME